MSRLFRDDAQGARVQGAEVLGLISPKKAEKRSYGASHGCSLLNGLLSFTTHLGVNSGLTRIPSLLVPLLLAPRARFGRPSLVFEGS